MKKFYIFIIVFCTFIISADAQNLERVLTAKYVEYKHITIDGIISSKEPWASADWVIADNAKASNTTDAMTAQFQLLWDDCNLYFAARVDDITRNIGNPTTYTNDCIEVFIDIDTTVGDTKYKTGTWQIRKQAGPDGLVDGAGGDMSNFYIASTDDGSAYIQEWALPWEALTVGMDDPMIWKTNGCIKFDVQIADATSDGVRTQQQFWNDNSDLQWNNTSKFGLIKMWLIMKKSNGCALDGVSEMNATEIKIFPVPASNKLFIESSETITTVEVFTITGHKLLVVNDKELNISNLKPGSYLARINTASGSVVKGFVKK